jgi:hypothetical protein
MRREEALSKSPEEATELARGEQRLCSTTSHNSLCSTCLTPLPV